jgi:hypothetical protein
LLAWQSGAAAAGQQPETIIQTSSDLLGCECLDASRGQFDRQRDAIQSVGNGAD